MKCSSSSKVFWYKECLVILSYGSKYVSVTGSVSTCYRLFFASEKDAGLKKGNMNNIKLLGYPRVRERSTSTIITYSEHMTSGKIYLVSRTLHLPQLPSYRLQSQKVFIWNLRVVSLKRFRIRNCNVFYWCEYIPDQY